MFYRLLPLIVMATLSWQSSALSLQAIRPQPDEPMIVFEETLHDFGKVSRSKDSTRSHTFVFTNTGTNDLVILQAISSCGCTVPKYTKTPVKPGKKGKVVVHYNATGQRTGFFAKSVTVYINSSHSYTRIFVKGEVE